MLAFLFDHDGTLVSSEQLVFEASCSLINETIQQKGVRTHYTADELKRYIGMGFTQILMVLALQHGFTVMTDELRHLAAKELELVIACLETKVEATEGAAEMLAQVRDWGVQRAIVSSAEMRRLRVCLRKTGLDRLIPAENVFSAQNSLENPESKPSPAIYRHSMRKLGIAPENCLAVEDSPPGVQAAVQAHIRVVGYVGAEVSSKQTEHGRRLVEAGAIAVFDTWAAFLDWSRPCLLT